MPGLSPLLKLARKDLKVTAWGELRVSGCQAEIGVNDIWEFFSKADILLLLRLSSKLSISNSEILNSSEISLISKTASKLIH